jgi:hypothetical protein
MRLVSLCFVLLLYAACGQQGGSGSSSSNDGRCNLNGRSVACESIRGADGQGIDLLDSMIDVPIKVQDAEITFMSDKVALAQGRRIDCRVAVKNGEVYRFAVRGDKLLVMTGEGSFEMERLNDGAGLLGTWFWKGYVDQGTHLIRQMTFLSTTRVIMKNVCEL